jgi:hypothetical protein
MFKEEILKVYRQMVDPFNIEIIGEKFDYENNPANPQQPQKNVEISKFENKWD